MFLLSEFSIAQCQYSPTCVWKCEEDEEMRKKWGNSCSYKVGVRVSDSDIHTEKRWKKSLIDGLSPRTVFQGGWGSKLQPQKRVITAKEF